MPNGSAAHTPYQPNGSIVEAPTASVTGISNSRDASKSPTSATAVARIANTARALIAKEDVASGRAHGGAVSGIVDTMESQTIGQKQMSNLMSLNQDIQNLSEEVKNGNTDAVAEYHKKVNELTGILSNTVYSVTGLLDGVFEAVSDAGGPDLSYKSGEGFSGAITASSDVMQDSEKIDAMGAAVQNAVNSTAGIQSEQMQAMTEFQQDVQSNIQSGDQTIPMQGDHYKLLNQRESASTSSNQEPRSFVSGPGAWWDEERGESVEEGDSVSGGHVQPGERGKR